MSIWHFPAEPDPTRSGTGRRILAKLLRSAVPVDGGFGRVRRAADPSPGADGPPCADEVQRPNRPAARPALPTHARNAVEEWIPSAILYGPPR